MQLTCVCVTTIALYMTLSPGETMCSRLPRLPTTNGGFRSAPTPISVPVSISNKGSKKFAFHRPCLARRDPFPIFVISIDMTIVKVRRRWQRAIQGVESVSFGLRHDPVIADAEGEGAQGPE